MTGPSQAQTLTSPYGMSGPVKLWEILDWIDDRILRHRIYVFCKLVVFTWPPDDETPKTA